MIKRVIRRIRVAQHKKKQRSYYASRSKNLSDEYVLTPEQEKEILSYYKSLTGMKAELSIFNYYTEKTGRFCKNYIPDDLYYLYIDKWYNDATESKAFSNKCYANAIFPGIKMPETIIRRINGFWYSNDDAIVDKDYVRRAVQNQNALFIKQASYSSGGKGVYYLSETDGNIVEQFWNIVASFDVDIIVQKPFKQHNNLARVNESSVNTIRILTFQRADGSVKVCSAILRMGISGSKVDNASSGGITCGIDENGHCRNAGYYSYVNAGKRLLQHPTSNIPFNEIIIPNYDKVVKLVTSAQFKLPHFRLVSWDVAIGEDGEPALIEVNLLKGEIDFHQLNNGPLFGDETEDILREVFSR